MEPEVENPTLLDEQLCFALHDASRAMTGCYRPLLDDMSLSYSQYMVMLVLFEEPSITLGALCARLHLDSGTLSPLITRLERRGLVERRRRPEDERTVQISITPEGEALRGQVPPVQSAVARATGMDMADIVELRDKLNQLSARLRAIRAENG